MSQRLNLLRRTILAACALLIPTAYAQSPAAPLTYEVVSIHSHDPADHMSMVRNTDDGYTSSNTALRWLIVSAFGLKTDDQVIGLHGALNDARFDIHAKADADTAATLKKLTPEQRRDQIGQMMRTMLEDRFQLKTHTEKRELPTYNLVQAKGGTKLKDADPANTYPNGLKGFDGKTGGGGMMRISRGTLTAQAIPLSNLALNLQGQVHRIVIDKTGLTGKYDIALNYSLDDLEHSGTPDDSGAPPLFTALQEQLGLKLEPSKTIVDVVVIDHVETPSEN